MAPGKIAYSVGDPAMSREAICTHTGVTDNSECDVVPLGPDTPMIKSEQGKGALDSQAFYFCCFGEPSHLRYVH